MAAVLAVERVHGGASTGRDSGDGRASAPPAGVIAALSHADAARLWRMLRPGLHIATPEMHVVANRRSRPLDGVRVHQSRSLSSRDVTRRDRIPVTSVARTLLDLADACDLFELVSAVDEAAFRRQLNMRAVADVMRRNRGRRAVTALSHALDLYEHGCAGFRSELEKTYLGYLHELGVPEPFVGFKVAEAGGIEGDFVWPLYRLCVEIDGDAHTRPTTRREDDARDRDLVAAGYEVLRCRPHHMRRHAERVARRLETLGS